uniref:RCC1-like domain-containing protein n=1 Tax=Ciona savignyi TaxID=51511 RepID=H2Z7N2_CIOSA
MPSGVILTLGEGSVGQLGLGDEVMTRKKPAVVPDISQEEIKKIKAGGMHTVCLTNTNKIYTFGCNDEFALGRPTDDDDSEYSPKLVLGPVTQNQVVHLTAGDSHTCVLTETGRVFVWGSFRDSRGRLGMMKPKEAKTPTELTTIKEPVIDVASGNDHVAMATASGQVLTMGCSEQGQIGRVSRYFNDRGGRRTIVYLLVPTKICIHKVRGFKKPKIIKVFCSAYATWVVSTDGHIFGFGLNNYKQLGFEDGVNRHMPEHVDQFSDIGCVQIAGGQHHTLLLDKHGSVYSLGRGEYGRLGHGTDITQADEPIKINTLQNITSISASSAVSFALDKDGKAWGWGLGTNLQLTTGTEDDVWTPTQLTGRNLETRKILEIGSGGQHTVILAQDQP